MKRKLVGKEPWPWTSLPFVFSREDMLSSLCPVGVAESACCRLVLVLALRSLALEDPCVIRSLGRSWWG